ncbi:MAG: hypothetical protein KAR05_02135 [Candidatus Omnitrophica bacterium]|nr:hypothetical protein [Candidatus Omnitrophota bacterium]
MINLIPMAGKGNRFFQKLYNLPKPFIPVMGKPMFLSAEKSFPAADQHIFICLEEHYHRYNLEEVIKKDYPQAEIIVLDHVTEGQACTCLLAERFLNKKEGLFIASCDYQMLYDHKRHEDLMRDDKVDVIIWTFKTASIKKANPKGFAYCCLEGARVTRIVEKETISDNPCEDQAVVGSFTFKRSEDFVHCANKMIEKNVRVNNEFYVATSINQLIEEGKHVVAFEIDQFISFGTPVELQLFQYWEDYFDQLEDHPYSINYGFKKVLR